MAEDKVPESYGSDNDEASFTIKDEEDHELQRSKAGAGQGHSMAHAATTAASNGHGLHGGPFMGDLPVRGTPFHPPMIQTDMASQQHSFVENGGLQVSDQGSVSGGSGGLTIDMVASPHDASRRPSVFSDYASPGGGALYHQPWQPSSAGPSSSSMYAYTGQQGGAPAPAFVGQAAVQLGAGPAFMAGSFEAPPRPDYDGGAAAAGAMFRAGDLQPAPVGQQQGYYVPGDGRGGLRVMAQVVDGVARNTV